MPLSELETLPSAPWFSCELQKMKAAGHVLERCLKVTGLPVHRQANRGHQKAHAMSLRDARSGFYSGIINSSPGEFPGSKQLFYIINHILELQANSHLKARKERCNSFITFFWKNVDTIPSLRSSSSALLVSIADLQHGTPQPLTFHSESLRT